MWERAQAATAGLTWGHRSSRAHRDASPPTLSAPRPSFCTNYKKTSPEQRCPKKARLSQTAEPPAPQPPGSPRTPQQGSPLPLPPLARSNPSGRAKKGGREPPERSLRGELPAGRPGRGGAASILGSAAPAAPPRLPRCPVRGRPAPSEPSREPAPSPAPSRRGTERGTGSLRSLLAAAPAPLGRC